MRIHIVSRDFETDHILARKIRVLTAHPAFSGGPAPDPHADLNYFWPYLEWDRFRSFDATPLAAWFSHRDAGRDGKVEMWDACAARMDLRLTGCKLYEEPLKALGPTARLNVPLDRLHFMPGPRERHARPRIGTSGFVYPAGRKGEALLGALAARRPEWEFVAIGEGWPVPTRHVAWEDVPAYYRSLDVYVCTSTIEGVGYGPLEAMACGVPVVIPRGVGVFDELPALENLHRYRAGDLEDCDRALSEALEALAGNGYNPASLRGATERFNDTAWLEGHLDAFERVLYNVPYQPPAKPWHGKAGVYYVAYGPPARECAVRAIASLKAHMPGLPVALVSDTPLGAGEDVFIQHEDIDIGGRSVKTRIYDLAPQEWEYVLYLDADTEVVADISLLFDALEDGWDVVYCINPDKYVTTTHMRRPDNGPECDETFAVMGGEDQLQLNGGVFSFRRNEATARFFRRWHEEWQRWGARDQAALLRVLYTEPVRMYVLGNEWNLCTRYLDASRGLILHYQLTARRWRGLIDGRLDSGEAWAAVHPAHKPEARG